MLFLVNAKVMLNPVHLIKEGSNVSMTCTVTGYPNPTNIYWRFAHRAVENSESYTMLETRKNPGEISSTLTAIHTMPKMNGTYVCDTPDGTNETQLVVESKSFL